MNTEKEYPGYLAIFIINFSLMIGSFVINHLFFGVCFGIIAGVAFYGECNSLKRYDVG